jgi:hypothetical protein
MLQKHLGAHQEQLALFVLPPNLEATEEDVDDERSSLEGAHDEQEDAASVVSDGAGSIDENPNDTEAKPKTWGDLVRNKYKIEQFMDQKEDDDDEEVQRWPVPMQDYVKRALDAANSVPGMSRQAILSKLNETYRYYHGTERLDQVNWSTYPLPQEILLEADRIREESLSVESSGQVPTEQPQTDSRSVQSTQAVTPSSSKLPIPHADFEARSLSENNVDLSSYGQQILDIGGYNADGSSADTTRREQNTDTNLQVEKDHTNNQSKVAIAAEDDGEDGSDADIEEQARHAWQSLRAEREMKEEKRLENLRQQAEEEEYRSDQAANEHNVPESSGVTQSATEHQQTSASPLPLWSEYNESQMPSQSRDSSEWIPGDDRRYWNPALRGSATSEG